MKRIVGSLAALALLPLAMSPGNAQESQGSHETAAVCVDVLLLTVHGLGEGPNPEELMEYSPTLAAVEAAFSKDFLEDHPDVLYSMDSVPYAAPDLKTWKGKGEAARISAAKDAAVEALSERYDNRVKGCDRLPVLTLAGFSLGAWAVGDWAQESAPASLLAGAALIGDPQYLFTKKSKAVWKGLARRSGVGYGKYPPSSIPSESWRMPCNWLDPVCGRGYSGAGTQFAAAVGCVDNGCSHHQYVDNGKAEEMGEWLSNQASSWLESAAASSPATG